MFDPPIPTAELARRLEARPRLSEPPDIAVSTSIFVTGKEPTIDVVNVERVNVERVDNRPGGDADQFRLDLEFRRQRIGVHSVPPGITGTRLEAKRDLLRDEDHARLLTGFLPDHLDLELLPARLEKSLRRSRRIAYRRDPEVKYATTVFAPDSRYTFSDTAFPWCTTGRISVAGGWASGTMVGPRHVLTCSHAMSWINPPNPNVAGWVKFTPSYFDGSEPFGSAWGTHVYWQQQVTPPTISGTEGEFDYVVIVLDRPIGELTGWMGSRSYSDSWDNEDYWSHIGYPGDLASGERASYQRPISLNGDDNLDDSHQPQYHTGDVWPGQSGGSFFGWWDGEPWPRVVGVQSWETSTTNGASGGSSMVDLIIRARNEHP